MGKVLQIVLMFLVCLGCNKSNDSALTQSIGEWDFEVTYSDQNSRETVYSCLGNVELIDKKVLIHHCINDFIEVEIKENGSVYSLNKELIGLIKDDICLITLIDKENSSIAQVKITGKKL